MDNSNLYNTGTGLSGLDNGYFSQITADQIIVESNLQLPNDLTLPTDLLPLQNNRDALNGLQAGEIVVKGTTNDTYSSIPTSNDFNTTTNDIVRKTSGRINTDTISIGDSTSTLGDANIKKTSGNAELFLISPSSNIPRLYLIRNAGSDTFAGDAASDWTMMNQSGNLVFERGNAFLQNGYLTPFRVTFYNTIELNYYNSGAIVDVCPLRHYRQISGQTNNYYVDIKPSSNVAGQYTHLLPAENGTYITDATSEYVNLNTMYTNINAQTNNNLLIKTGTNTFSSTPNNSSNWDTAYTDSQTNKSDIATIKGVGWTNETIKGNADDIATNTAWRSDFDTQTLDNLLFRDGTSTFGNIAMDDGFGTSALVVKKDANGFIKSRSYLAQQAETGYMFESYQNTNIISYLYHSTQSGTGVAVQMPSTSGVMAVESQIYWESKNTNDIVNKNFGKIFLGESGGDGIAASGDVVISNRNDSNVEIELRSDDTSLVSPQDYLIGKIQAGFDSSSYQDSYFKFQTHFSNNTNLNDLLTLKGQTCTLDGTLNVSSTATFQGTTNFENTMTLYNGSPNLILRDTTDSDDVQLRMDGIYGGINVTNARITTANNYLNLETTNNAPMNGIIIKTNLTNAITIDNNQNIETTGAVGIAKAPAVGYALDVDGTLPSIFRGDVNFLGTARYDAGIELNSGVFNNTIDTNTLTANRAINFPDSSGTLALTNTGGVFTTTGNDIYNSNSGNVFIGATSGSEKLEVTGNVKILSGNLQVSELQGTLGSSTKIDLNPPSGGGNIDLVVPNSAGGISPNVDINFKTGSDIRMNLNSIDGLVFHENFIFKNTAGSTYFPLSFNGAVANSLNVGTNVLNVSAGNLAVQSGTTTSGINATIGVTKIGNGLSNYAMFAHTNNFNVGSYAVLQQNDGVTFINAASGKDILFRINNSTIGGIDDSPGAERTFFNSKTQTLPEYDSSQKLVANYCSLDNPAFRVFSGSGTQTERQVMYSQVVVNSSTSGFTQVALPLTDWGTQPGFVTNEPGFAFRVCDPGREAQVHVSFSGYTTANSALQVIKLQLYAHPTTGTRQWVDIASYDFFVNDANQHLCHSFSKLLTFTYSFYSFVRLQLVSGTFTASSDDSLFVTIDELPRQTR